MRRSSQSVALLAALALFTAGTASAFVQPERGTVLPNYDIRRGGVLDDGNTDLGSDMSPTLGLPTARPDLYRPDASERAALERLRQRSPRLEVEFLPSNGLPRSLHAWGAPLTPASSAAAADIARAFVGANPELFKLTAAEVQGLVIVRDYPTHGVFHTVWLAQAVDGILVDHSAIRFNLNPEGRILWVSAGMVVPGLTVATSPALSPEEAIVIAARHVEVELGSAPALNSPRAGRRLMYEPGTFLSDVLVEQNIMPMGDGTAALTWRVYLEPNNVGWYVVDIDAHEGELLARQNLYKFVTNEGLVFDGNYPIDADPTTHPRGVPQTRVSFGYNWPSTTGWTTPAPYGNYRLTEGNNVETKEDWLGDNETTIGLFADGGTEQDFDFPFQNSYASSPGLTDVDRIADVVTDIEAIVTNLFFWNNKWHDRMHALGFDEVSGNFQFDNFSRGGCGSDAVRADANDNAMPAGGGGPSLNNANFGTPPEPVDCANPGSFRPRMQQFLSRFGDEAAPTWLGDTSLDADVIIHEFSHGTSNRLVGGPFVGCVGGGQAGAMGEGWGDWYAASNFDDPIMGEYSFADPVAGVRCFPMDANPRTYADLCQPTACRGAGCQVHSDGEVHAATLWDLRSVVGKEIADQLVTDGMKFAPCSPIYPDYRDALIMADRVRYGGAHVCDIWDAYFARGVGFDATSPDGANPIADFIFNGPECSGLAHLRYEAHTTTDMDGDGLYSVGEVIDLNVVLNNISGASTATGVSATVTTTTPGITMVAGVQPYADIAVGGTAAPGAPFQFRIEPGFVCGGAIDFDVDMAWTGVNRIESFVEAGGKQDGVVIYTDDAEGAGLPLTGPAGISTAQNHTGGGSQSYYMLDGCFMGPVAGCGADNMCANTCATITLPEFNLPADRGAVMKFWMTYNSQQAWDGVYVQVSTDGGNSFQYVADVNYTGTLNGRNGGCNTVTRPGINGPPGNANLEPWTEFSASLVAFAGQPAIIQIVNHMSGCNEFEGPYVDDISIVMQECQSTPIVSTLLSSNTSRDDVNPACTDMDGAPDPGETVEVTLGITNSGNTTLTAVNGTLGVDNTDLAIAAATLPYGDIASGATVTQTFSYDVAMVGPGCHNPANFTFDIDANGGGHSDNYAFSKVVRTETAIGTWFDDIEGTRPPWTPSLGPDGTEMDWQMKDSAMCSGHGFYWATNPLLDPTTGNCGSGEPDYGPDSDSVLTSPIIDLGRIGSLLTRLSFRVAPDNFPGNWGATVDPGFVQVLIDHDGDGTFTIIADWMNGLNSTNQFLTIDIQNNPAGVPILAADTAQMIQLQIRFRALGPDPSIGRGDDGMIFDDVLLEWSPCDVNACAPGLTGRGRLSATSDSQRGTAQRR